MTDFIPVAVGPQIIHSNWCIRCLNLYRQYEPSVVVYQGNSLCEECFKENVKVDSQ